MTAVICTGTSTRIATTVDTGLAARRDEVRVRLAVPQGAVEATDRRRRRPARPNYAARRVVAAVAAVVAAAVLILAAMAAISAVEAWVDLGGRPAAASEIDPTRVPTARRHVAQPGDTLWSIADTYRGDIGRSGYIDALIRLNGGTEILVGQAIVLP